MSSCRGILSFLKNTCFRIDRITRREQERQRRRNIQQLLAKDVLEVPVRSGVYTPKAALPKDWDTRWIEIPCVDVILTSSPDQDGTRWDSEWPGAFVTARDHQKHRGWEVETSVQEEEEEEEELFNMLFWGDTI